MVDGKIVTADGVYKEYEIAKKFGLFPLPVPATGFMSEQIANELLKEDYYKELI